MIKKKNNCKMEPINKKLIEKVLDKNLERNGTKDSIGKKDKNSINYLPLDIIKELKKDRD